MLQVKTPEEAAQIIDSHFGRLRTDCETAPLREAPGRMVYGGVVSGEFIPGFDRSAMDGYALVSADTFGCSDSLPSMLRCIGESEMGKAPGFSVAGGECAYVHTGSGIPAGADAVVMIEYTEGYGDGTVGILSPCAPGENIVLKGDDTVPGKKLYADGHCLRPHDIGALSALGQTSVPVYKKPSVGIISTGNELVPANEVPGGGQMRDVNSGMLEAAVTAAGGEARLFGISPDDEESLARLLEQAGGCDLILLSGGSSAGAKDIALAVIGRLGETFVHGIAIKPGKPTIIGKIGGAPVFCLPGHPVAAYYVFTRFVYPLIRSMQGSGAPRRELKASLGAALPSNHGREEFVPVSLTYTGNAAIAAPVRGKSGLITLLSGTQGYVIIPRDCEGLAQNEAVTVYLYD